MPAYDRAHDPEDNAFRDLEMFGNRPIKIFRKEKPDIVHTHTPKAGLLGMLAAKFSGCKTRIHTVAGLPLMAETGFKYHLLIFIEKLTHAAASNVWPNSYSLLQFITDKNLCKPGKLHIIAKGSTNGININRFNEAALMKTGSGKLNNR
ncbi:MAG: glycosyltransferase [Chitinophagaceae bacterium]|nr:glycosyltransferase [Chitinophagaceae bacterium]